MTTITFEQIQALPKAFHLVRLDADKAPIGGWKTRTPWSGLKSTWRAGAR